MSHTILVGGATPLYQRLAQDLRSAIVSGEYGPGAQLPTELDLCATRGVSRHTAREALRILREEGLIERRRGAGTIVAAAARDRAFVQSLGSVDDILQYARDTRLAIDTMGLAPAHARGRRDLGFSASEDVVRIVGARRNVATDDVVALTTIFVRKDLCPAQADIDARPGAINTLIAERSGLFAASIDQEITAVSLSAADARALDCQPGDAALKTIRRYRDAAGAIYQGSISLHPSDRFAYKITLKRT